MHPSKKAEEALETGNSTYDMAKAQVYATLALAQAIEGVGTDIKETFRMIDVELASIAQAIDSMEIGK